MTLDLSPRLAITILLGLVIWCSDVWLYAWNESGPPAACPISEQR